MQQAATSQDFDLDPLILMMSQGKHCVNGRLYLLNKLEF